jgi:hypothetical protein
MSYATHQWTAQLRYLNVIILRIGPSILLYIIFGYLVVDTEGSDRENPGITPPPIFVHKFHGFCLYLSLGLSATEANDWHTHDPSVSFLVILAMSLKHTLTKPSS